MVHHIVLFKLKPEVTPARVEEMMMNARMQLLKIPEVLSIKCGKRIDPELPWPFFIAIDFESMDKYEIFREDPIHVKFMEEVIKPNTADSLTLDFEMDPGERRPVFLANLFGSGRSFRFPSAEIRKCDSLIFIPAIRSSRRPFATCETMLELERRG